MQMKYGAYYYKPMTEEEKSKYSRKRLLFGLFQNKKDAVKSVKERFGVHELVKDCTFAEVVRISDGATVFCMEV